MAQYTFRDIEEFLLDDDFFQWARYGFSDNGFDIKFYKIQHPGCEEKIELAIAVIQNMKVVEDSKPVSEEYKIMNPDERILFDNHIHMTEKLWNMACDKAASEKPVLSFAYIVWELHFPLLCGYLTNEPVINGFYEVGLKDMSGYIEQQFKD